jgi:ketosteroid isomerase-like protein
VRNNWNRSSSVGNNRIVYEYFRLIRKKDVNTLLSLFADDAIVYEPFSNIDGGLKGKDSIKPFLDVVMMANDGMRHEIESVKASDNKEKDEKVALVTFERGEKVQARYTFELTSKQKQYEYTDEGKKIRTLHIEFISN